MNEEVRPYLTACPVGCIALPKISDVLLKEGALQRCPDCGQLFSSCSVLQYEDSLQKWDTYSGTNPDSRSVTRYEQVTRQRLRGAMDILPPCSGQPTLLDVGCSSGALLGIARDMGLRVLAGRTGFDVVKVETRNVRFFEKGQCTPLAYRFMKILADILAFPAKVTGRGHDLLVYMCKQERLRRI